MIKRILATAATVALLASGGAWAQTSAKTGIGVDTSIGAKSGDTGVSTNDKTRANVGAAKRSGVSGDVKGGNDMTGSSGSTGIGAGSSTGVGVGAGSGGAAGSLGTTGAGAVKTPSR